MTKLFSIIAVAIIATTVVSCGPSAEEKLKMEAAHQADSIAAATRAADSLAALEGTMVPDSTVVDTTVAVEAAH